MFKLARQHLNIFCNDLQHNTDFLVIVSSTSCCCTVYVLQGQFELDYCLFSELPSASVRVRHTRAHAAAHPLECDVSRCRTSQFARCFLSVQTRVWNDLSHTVFDTGTLDGFKGAVIRWLLPKVCFSVFRSVCGVAKATYKQLRFFHLTL